MVGPGELLMVVDAFVAMTDPVEVPAGAALTELEVAIDHAEEARFINGTQPLLPPPMAQELEQALVNVQAALGVAVQDVTEEQTPW